VRRWRLERSVEATVTRRPDLVNLNWKKYPEEVRLMVEHFTSGAAKDQE
jgi:tRNA G37 N-methylase TrmD